MSATLQTFARWMGYDNSPDSSSYQPQQHDVQLEVIGVGLPRTGSVTLRTALCMLGYKTYHQIAAMGDAQKLNTWNTIIATKLALKQRYGAEPNQWYNDEHVMNTNNIDFHAIYHRYGYNAAVCLPTYLIYKEILAKYPKMKVILTKRDAAKWYESVYSSIRLVRALMDRWFIAWLIGKQVPQLVDDAFFQHLLDGKIETDKAFVMRQFDKWNEMVEETVPKQQLLVFDAKQGWEPLCKFLDKPVPNEPFPRTNSKEKIRKMVTVMNMVCNVVNIGIIAGVGYLGYKLYVNETHKHIMNVVSEHACKE